MWSYFKKLALFSIPIWLYVFFIALVDPYNFVGISHFIKDVDKISVLNRSNESGPRGNMLWKAISFRKDPLPIVLIGDSQGRKIKEELIKEVSGESCFNFCVPGASFATSYENFWFIAETVNLKKVYFVISFMSYNASRDYSLSHFASDYLEKPYKYFATKEILFDSWVNLLYHVTHDEKYVNNPYDYQSVEELDSLSVSQYDLFFGDYKYPDQYYTDLKSIKEYCEEHNVELMFIVLPIYQKLEEYLNQSELKADYDKFREDIKSIAPVLDYSHYADMNDQRENFIDYYHLKQEPLNEVTTKIWEDLKHVN